MTVTNEPESTSVEVADGVWLRVLTWRTSGPGVPFLLVHGLSSNARLWTGVGELLAARGHPVVAVDQRGHGQSSKPEAGYDFETLTNDLLTVCSVLGVGRPVVVGQSWGGNVALELGHRHPRRVVGVVGVDGGTIELSRTFPDWQHCAQALAPPKLTGTPYATMQRAMRDRHPEWPQAGIDGQLANFRVRADGTIEPHLTYERHMLILRHLWEQRPSRFYPELTVPVLLLPVHTGDAEWTAGKRASIDRAAAQIPKVRVEWIRDRDHDVHAQDPVLVAEQLQKAVDDGFLA